MPYSRRTFLKKAGGVMMIIACFSALIRYLTPKSVESEIVLREKIDKIPEGGALIYSDKLVVLMKKNGVISAVSMKCTHLGCTIALDGDRFVCPCHGSVFAIDGRVLHGPAVRKLGFYATEERNGVITVINRLKA